MIKDSHQSASSSITAKRNDLLSRAKRTRLYNEIQETVNVPEGNTEGEDGTRSFSLQAYGVPVESEAFVREWLQTRVERIKSNMLEIENYWTSRDCESRDSVTLIPMATYSDTSLV